MAIPNIEIRHLKYFVAVAEDSSYRRAALRLHISQPPLTRQVQQLEEELGVELFCRKGRGVELTAAGELFFIEAKNVLALTEQAIDKVRMAGIGKIGRLDVGVFGSAILDVIPKIINSFRQIYPDVSIVLHDLNKAEQIKALREGRLTVGFNRYVWDEPDIAKECVLREPLYVAFRPDDNLFGKESVAVLELKKWPLIIYPRNPRPGFADKVVSLCHSRGFEPNIVQEVDDVVTAIALVSSGFGITIVSESATNLRLPNVTYRSLERCPETVVELYCQYLRDDKSPILRAFLDIVQSGKVLDHSCSDAT